MEITRKYLRVFALHSVTKATPIRAVRNGSSPEVALPASPAAITEDMNVETRSPALHNVRRPAAPPDYVFARGFCLMTTAISWIKGTVQGCREANRLRKDGAVPALATPYAGLHSPSVWREPARSRELLAPGFNQVGCLFSSTSSGTRSSSNPLMVCNEGFTGRQDTRRLCGLRDRTDYCSKQDNDERRKHLNYGMRA